MDDYLRDEDQVSERVILGFATICNKTLSMMLDDLNRQSISDAEDLMAKKKTILNQFYQFFRDFSKVDEYSDPLVDRPPMVTSSENFAKFEKSNADLYKGLAALKGSLRTFNQKKQVQHKHNSFLKMFSRCRAYNVQYVIDAAAGTECRRGLNNNNTFKVKPEEDLAILNVFPQHKDGDKQEMKAVVPSVSKDGIQYYESKQDFTLQECEQTTGSGFRQNLIKNVKTIMNKMVDGHHTESDWAKELSKFGQFYQFKFSLCQSQEQSATYAEKRGQKTEYTFMNPKANSLTQIGKEFNDTNADDFAITWTSSEQCKTDKSQKYKVKMFAFCSDDTGSVDNSKFTIVRKNDHVDLSKQPMKCMHSFTHMYQCKSIVVRHVFRNFFLLCLFGFLFGFLGFGLYKWNKTRSEKQDGDQPLIQ